MDKIHGKRIHHFKTRDAFRHVTKGERGFTLIWVRWQLAHNWPDAWVRYLLYHSVSSTMPRNSKENEVCTHFIYAMLTRVDGATSVAETRVLGSERAIKNLTKGEKKSKLGRTFRRRTSSAILLVQKLNMVEFVCMDSKLEKKRHQHSWQDDKWSQQW